MADQSEERIGSYLARIFGVLADLTFLSVGGCSLRILREVQEDGTESFLGDVGFDRCGFPYHEDAAKEDRLVYQTEQREVEDEEIV